MSIEGLLSIRGDASGAIDELRKVSAGLERIREKGQRAGPGIATAINSLSSGLMKFQFTVAGVATAFEVLKAGAAAAKWAWDRWAISPSVKSEIKWLAEQRKANDAWMKEHQSASAVNQRIYGRVGGQDDSDIEAAAKALQHGRENSGLMVSGEKWQAIRDVFMEAFTAELKPGKVASLEAFGIDFYATGSQDRDREALLKTFKAIQNNTQGFNQWGLEQHNANEFDPANTRQEYARRSRIKVTLVPQDQAMAEYIAGDVKVERGGGGMGAAAKAAPTLDDIMEKPWTVVVLSSEAIDKRVNDALAEHGITAGMSAAAEAVRAGRSSMADALSLKIGSSKSEDQKFEEWRNGMTTSAGAVNAFSDAMAAGVDAAISGERSIGKAMMSAAASALRSRAVQASVEALWETAKGISGVANGNPGAAAHFAAAGKYAAVAALAGAGAAALGHAVGGMGGGGSGAGASAPAASAPRASASEQGINVVINIGHGFVGSEKDLGDTVSRAVDQARRNGRGKTTPQWD